MKRTLTCIICPRGCTLTAEVDREGVTVSGNGCPKGKQYAIDECTNPTRTVTSSVRVQNRDQTMVSVKTEQPVSKDRIFEVMKAIRSASVLAPIHLGDVLIENICGTNLIATKNID